MGLRKVRIGIVGVGNCASSLVQGLTYYCDAQSNEPAPGLMHIELGGYHISDVEISAALDINVTKIGKDISEKNFSRPNNTQHFSSATPTGVTIRRGMTLDALEKYLSDVVEESKEEPADVTKILRHLRTDVLVSYLLVGVQKATGWYAECALEASYAFVDCIPVFIASKPDWQRRFKEWGFPIVGDDIKSQVGATIVHRVLANLFRKRGLRLDRTCQLNFGGNTASQSMLEREHLESKKISETQAVLSQLNIPLTADDIHVRPSDHVPWLTDRKWAYIPLKERLLAASLSMWS